MSPDPVSWLVVERGWTVLGANGEELGKVQEVLGDKESDIFDGLSVSTSLLGKPQYLAAEHVGRIEQGTVHADVDELPAA